MTAVASFEQRVELDRIRVFFSLAKGNMLAMLVGAGVLALLMRYAGLPDSVLSIWCSLFFVSGVGVLLFERRVKRQGLTLANCERLLRIRVPMGIGMASFYGMGALMTPMHAPPLVDALLLLMLSTVVSTATLAYAVMPAQYLWISGACFTPLLGRFVYRGLSQQDATYGLLALMALIWLAVVLSKSRAVSRSAYEALALNRRLQDEIEEHQQTREALRQLALVDPLTGLGNRRHFDATLHRTLGQAERDGQPFGVLAIDLDDFKPVNDRFGHPVGDALLQSVAQRLQVAVRTGDFCARVGGDEFAVIVHGVRGASDLQAVSQKLRAELEQANPFNVAAPPSRASVGWAIYPDDGNNAIDLMALADARMYLDKNANKLPQITRRPRR